MASKPKKLSKKDRDALWGERGPYSEVHMVEQTRILDDSISRIFLAVEAKINPFTFEYFLEHEGVLPVDSPIHELLKYAEYRGPQEGYVVSAGEEELIDKRSFELVHEYRDSLVKEVLYMHDVVIEAFGLKRDSRKLPKGILLTDSITNNEPSYVWDNEKGKVVPVNDDLWESATEIITEAGVKNNKIRYFLVLALAGKKHLVEREVAYSAEVIKRAARQFNIDIENAEANGGYIMFTILISPDTVPADFVETCIAGSNAKKKLFHKEYLITNTSRPTGNEIGLFLREISEE